MSFLDRFRRKTLTVDPTVSAALQGGFWSPGTALGGTNVQAIIERWSQAHNATYGWMYRRQPAVRKVIHKIADNLSQISPKLYERQGDTERVLARDHPAAETLRQPDPFNPADRWIYDFVADYLVYENAYALMFPRGSGFPTTLIRWPVHRVVALGQGVITTAYRLYDLQGHYEDYPPERILHWKGYNPDDPRIGVSAMETLRDILAEDAASQAASTELAKEGLKGGHIERPLDAPSWKTEDAERFVEWWRNATKQTPRKTPVLEEGMKFINDAISPKDAQLLEGRQFTTDEVADVYGVPRGLFSENVTEEDRDTFYTDVVAPLSKKLACQLDLSIVEGIYGESEDYYFEFDLNEKLRGDPTRRFQAITAAVGAPWLARNEARGKEGLPPVDGGDELVTPLNVISGNNPRPAPNVMPIQNPLEPPQDGSYRETPKQLESADQKAFVQRKTSDVNRQKRHIDEATAVVERFYRRQLQTIKSVKSFDSQRWNRELSSDLLSVLKSIVEREGGIYTARLGGNDFDMRQVEHYLEAQASGIAEKLNEVTQRDFEGPDTAKEALDRAISERSAIAGASIGTRASVFARQEAAKQSPHREFRRQTWVADTDRHQDLDGVSVPLDSDWGGISPGSEPNCQCTAVVE